MGNRSPYERAKSIWDTAENLDYIFDSNKRWVQDCLEEDPEIFTRLKYAQAPKYLYIGCSDSRVPAQNMLGLTTGELFVHRNVANLCVNTDYSLLSVLTYAVEVLEVTDIIVCGHYGCGGVRAAMENKDHGLLEHWLMHIRNVQRLHQAELAEIPNEEERHQRLVELNVQEACMNLFANPVVQKKQATDAQPRIHGWVYDIGSGLLKDLKIDFRTEIRKYKNIYSLYEFPKSTIAGASAPVAPNGRMTPLKKVPQEALAAAADSSSSQAQSSGNLWNRLQRILP
ncbi:carbonic anhydrase [Tribonema minus]|uniref:Carbonic anhydrase n=1 Tax=Tribonema minus TaxID=303371 RepID=A0A835ZBM8_9STRA|nr:carbonic anhydrase [Tribonema minus]